MGEPEETLATLGDAIAAADRTFQKAVEVERAFVDAMEKVAALGARLSRIENGFDAAVAAAEERGIERALAAFDYNSRLDKQVIRDRIAALLRPTTPTSGGDR